MRRGYLAQVDYRLFVDDIDWDIVREASDHSYGLAELNAKLFLPQRDEAIRDELATAWAATASPRAIVFCRTIEHAERLADMLRRTPFGQVPSLSTRDSPRGNGRIACSPSAPARCPS